MLKDQRGILGLNTVKAFIVVLLALAIIGVVTLIVLGALNTPQLIATTGTTVTGTNFNETFTNATIANNFSVSSINGFNSASCSGQIVTNATGGNSVPASNFTLSNGGCVITGVSTTPFAADGFNVTYDFSFKSGSSVESITSNVSAGLVGFFTNSTTFFALLAVVVIILIISLVIVVVNRFGGESGGTATSAGL